MNYDVDYFIKFFEGTPEENFLIRKYGHSGRGCAMGLVSGTGAAHAELYKLGIRYLPECKACTPIIDVNNGDHPDYQQPTPKQRILAALNDIKKMQQPTHKDETSKFTSLIPIVDEVSDVVMNKQTV